jgi:hypothetical protein
MMLLHRSLTECTAHGSSTAILRNYGTSSATSYCLTNAHEHLSPRHRAVAARSTAATRDTNFGSRCRDSDASKVRRYSQYCTQPVGGSGGVPPAGTGSAAGKSSRCRPTTRDGSSTTSRTARASQGPSRHAVAAPTAKHPRKATPPKTRSSVILVAHRRPSGLWRVGRRHAAAPGAPAAAGSPASQETPVAAIQAPAPRTAAT